jgi:hypothetical protein
MCKQQSNGDSRKQRKHNQQHSLYCGSSAVCLFALHFTLLKENLRAPRRVGTSLGHVRASICCCTARRVGTSLGHVRASICCCTGSSWHVIGSRTCVDMLLYGVELARHWVTYVRRYVVVRLVELARHWVTYVRRYVVVRGGFALPGRSTLVTLCSPG